MQRLGNFHDGCVRELHWVTSHYVSADLRMHFDGSAALRMVVQRQFSNPSAIELCFAELVGLKVSPPSPNCDAIIFGAAFFLRDGVLYWAEDSAWKPESPDRHDCTWIAARRAWWRDASEWMGPDLRYRCDSGPMPASTGS